MQNHHLSKLIITSTTTSESEGFALRRLLKENWQQLLPDLTDSFDEICAEDEVIHLPKIIISLEINSTNSLVSNMPITHNETLKEQIKTQVMLQVQEFKAELNNSLSECTNINPIEHLNELSNKSKTNTNSNVLLIWQDVQSYLISGILPWYIMHQESVKDLIPQNNAQSLHLSMQLLIKNNIHQCMNALFEDRSSQTINRLVQLCDDDLRKYIFEQLIEQAFSKFKLLQIEKIDDAQLCSDALVYICGEILNEAVNPIELTNVLFNQLLGVQTAQNSVKNTSIQSSTLSRLIAKSAKRFTISEKVLTTLSSRIFSQPNQSNIERNVKSESKIQELQADKIKPLDNILDDKLFKDTRSVLFAGSILLYPYLYRLFKELGYLSADKKIKQSKQSRAVTLMIYLLRGEEQVFDYQLHFVKWLLGVPSNVLIVIEENSINKEEIAEADNVLLSLKAHWAVLKNTSFTNIRESFLQRPGMMKLYDEQCHITIERKGIDVLIDQIPFSLSMIRLPWIKQQIIVTW
jgi:hypothetical protein